MCATHLNVLYISMKFGGYRYSSIGKIAKTRFVIDGRKDGRGDFMMPLPSGA